ncbi:MAG: group 2 RNA polymerase sigma factor SigC [Arthrospira sp. SH-MAG29]|nr:group 2 RNA polymerase sigma factor SigC [Arthrospira sp. SH-MAG29]MBS0015432.1 group 2 RNA polymerase sigma factor SigC [Arthrospira sp. SH-MAG29]
MAENRLSETDTFLFEVNQSNASSYVSNPLTLLAVSGVVNSISATIDPRWLWRANVFLESLTASVWCPSFPRSPYPEFYPEDSAAERAAKLMKLESNHPKFGLQLLRRKSSTGSWNEAACPVIQNRGRRFYVPLINPYLTANEVKILGRFDRLGLSFKDYGDGILGGGSLDSNRIYDTLYIEGEYRIELDLILMAKRPANTVMNTITVSTSPVLLISDNPSRAYFEIQNQGETQLLWGFGTSGSDATSHPFKMPPGQIYYPGNVAGFIPSDAIWARVLEGTTTVLIVESSYQ